MLYVRVRAQSNPNAILIGRVFRYPFFRIANTNLRYLSIIMTPSSYLILILVALWVGLPIDCDLLRLVVHVRRALIEEDGQRPRRHVARGRPRRHAAGNSLHDDLGLQELIYDYE